MMGKSADGEAFDINATDVDLTARGLGEAANTAFFLGTAQYSDGASDPNLTVTLNKGMFKAVFSGAKLSSLTGSNVTVTGTLTC